MMMRRVSKALLSAGPVNKSLEGSDGLYGDRTLDTSVTEMVQEALRNIEDGE